MSATIGTLPQKDILQLIGDLSELVNFIKDPKSLDELHQKTLEQVKITENESKLRQEALIDIETHKKSLENIKQQSSKLDLDKATHEKNLNDFSEFKETERKRLSEIEKFLDERRLALIEQEKAFSEKSKNLQVDIQVLEQKNKTIEATYLQRDNNLKMREDDYFIKKSALDAQEKSIQEKLDKLKSIIN